MHTIGGKMQG